MWKMTNGLCCKLLTAGLLISLINLYGSILAAIATGMYFIIACKTLAQYGNKTPIYLDELLVFMILFILSVSWLITSFYLKKGVTKRRHEYVLPWLCWSITAMCFEAVHLILYPMLTDYATTFERAVLLVVHIYMFACVVLIYQKDKKMNEKDANVAYDPENQTIDMEVE